MPTFEKLRISLARSDPGELLAKAGHEEQYLSREQYLREAFSREEQFFKDGKLFTFTPMRAPQGFVAGFFKRERSVILRDNELSPYQAENYESALFILEHSPSQVAWCENNQRVGSPKPLVQAYLRYLFNKTELKDWFSYVRYFESEADYWEVIKSRRSEIAYISFTFIPPNALDSDDKVYEFIRNMQSARSETQQHTYRAPPGQMRPETPMMEASARVAMKGGGEALVKDQHQRQIYKTGQSRIVEKIEIEEMPSPKKTSLLDQVIDRLFPR